MNFDNTYITLFGYIIFEPITILTNLLIFAFSIFCFKQLTKFSHPYSNNMAWFVLLVGISSFVGSAAHGAHYQLGDLFFKTVFYIMNALSLISVYFCFNAPYIYYNKNKAQINKMLPYAVIVWIAAVLIYTLIQNNFVIVKIHAGVVLIYSLMIHLKIYNKTKEEGSKLVVTGIFISFLSIIVHSLKVSISAWFNYKDLAHIIIIVSLMVIYKGAKINSEQLKNKTA